MEASLSRRSFVAGTAGAAAAGVLATPLVHTEAALASEAPVEELQCDILACGLGASGVTAAVAAGREGAGGSTHCTAPAMFGSKAQNDANPDVPVTEQEAFEYIYPLTHYQENGALLREMIRRGAVVIDELVAAGMPFMFANTTVDADAPLRTRSAASTRYVEPSVGPSGSR